MIEKTTSMISSDYHHRRGYLPNTIWVLKSEHDELVKKLTSEVLELSYDVKKLKDDVDFHEAVTTNLLNKHATELLRIKKEILEKTREYHFDCKEDYEEFINDVFGGEQK